MAVALQERCGCLARPCCLGCGTSPLRTGKGWLRWGSHNGLMTPGRWSCAASWSATTSTPGQVDVTFVGEPSVHGRHRRATGRVDEPRPLRARPGRSARGALARCGGEPARRPRGHVHRPAARCRRPARREPHEHQLHREHDLDRARHDQEREAVARRQDDQTLVCRRVKGYRQMPTFVAALARHVEAVPPACDAARVA